MQKCIIAMHRRMILLAFCAPWHKISRRALFKIYKIKVLFCGNQKKSQMLKSGTEIASYISRTVMGVILIGREGMIWQIK